MFLVNETYLEVKETKDKGKGVFAKKEISTGTVIGDYLGKVIKNAEYNIKDDEKGLYLMYLTDEASIYPDLTKEDIHLINHSCMPNCWIYIFQGHTLFFALKNIKPKEELTISYLLGPDDTCKPCIHVCRCKTAACTGTFHLTKRKFKIWEQFQNKQKKGMKIATFIFGEDLPKLASYPDKISLDPIYTKMLTLK